MTAPDKIGKRIAIIREDVGLSQSALARLTRSAQSAVSQIEDGKRNPSYATLHKIAKAFDIGIDELVRGTKP